MTLSNRFGKTPGEVLYPEQRNLIAPNVEPAPHPLSAFNAFFPPPPPSASWTPAPSLLSGPPKEDVPARRRAFISFKSEDLGAVKLLRLSAKSEAYDLFYDESLREPFDSVRANYIRDGLRAHIKRTSVTICLLGQNTHMSRWVDWELFESAEKGNKIITMGVPDAKVLVLPRLLRQFPGTIWHLWDLGWLKEQLAAVEDPIPHR